MQSRKKEQFIELITHCIDLYLTENLEIYGFSHVIDVNMAEDLKTAFVYIAYPVEKNPKRLENIIMKSNKSIVEIFKQHFTSKFIPKLKFVFIEDEDVKF